MDRSKILVIAFVALLVVWQGSGIVTGIVFGPLNERADQVAAYRQQLADLETKQQALDLAELKLKTWTGQSLPPDPQIAATVYQHWLIDLTGKSKFTDVSVAPTSAVRRARQDAIFQRVGMSIKAECRMDQLCEFLYEFYRTDLMQRVALLEIDSQEYSENPRLKVTLNVEGLAFTAAAPRSAILSPKQEKSVMPSMKGKELDDYESLDKANLFVRAYNGPPRPVAPPPTPPPPTPPFDSAPHVFLVASVVTNGAPEAWLYDRSSNQRTVLSEGKSFEVAGVKGDCEEIGKDYVKLEVNDKPWRLELGQNLKQLQELDASGKPIPGKAPAPAATPAPPATGAPPASSPMPPATASPVPTVTPGPASGGAPAVAAPGVPVPAQPVVVPSGGPAPALDVEVISDDPPAVPTESDADLGDTAIE